MNAMRALDLDQITAIIATATKPINVLWQTDDSIAFVARGREGRSEFHVLAPVLSHPDFAGSRSRRS